jgi:hypothetical protein
MMISHDDRLTVTFFEAPLASQMKTESQSLCFKFNSLKKLRKKVLFWKVSLDICKCLIDNNKRTFGIELSINYLVRAIFKPHLQTFLKTIFIKITSCRKSVHRSRTVARTSCQSVYRSC